MAEIDSIQAEQAVLGSVLIDHGCFRRIGALLREEDFAVELDRAALSGDWASVMPHLWWVLAYAAAALAAAVLLFLRQMKKQ